MKVIYGGKATKALRGEAFYVIEGNEGDWNLGGGMLWTGIQSLYHNEPGR